MCGLVGIAGDCSGNWKDLFTELLLIDSVRGTHSTGAGFVSRDKKAFEVIKAPGDPFNLFNLPEYDKAVSTANTICAALGHNRYATVGEKTAANAHPFKFKHVMGMHNGTLHSYAHKRLKDHEKYGTDSQAIFASIDEIGAAATLKLIDGAWALVWVDKKDGTLNFLRNSQRPLHYCYSEDRSTIIWASEASMLTYIMNRRNKKMFIPDEKDHSGVFLVTADTHYKWKIPKFIVDKFDSPERTEMKGATFSWQGNSTANYKPKYEHAYGYGYTGGGYHAAADPNDIPFLQRPSSSKFRPPYKDASGKVLNKVQFTAMVNEGCCFCGQNGQQWNDFIKVMGNHVGPHTPYACEECYNDIDTYEYTKWVA